MRYNDILNKEVLNIVDMAIAAKMRTNSEKTRQIVIIKSFLSRTWTFEVPNIRLSDTNIIFYI